MDIFGNLPFALTGLDLLALGFLLLAWGGYTAVVDWWLDKPVALNQTMHAVRGRWIERLLERHDRIVDSSLVGHVIHSISFFASTTMLVLAGLIGLVGSLDGIYDLAMELSFTQRTAPETFQFKMLVLMAIFVFSFMKFTWSIRQLTFSCALIGAAPLAPVAEAEKAAYARQLGQVLSLGIVSFNGGLRAHYFALATLGWFLHSYVFIAMTALMLAVLIRRQLYSRTFRAIRSIAFADPPPT